MSTADTLTKRFMGDPKIFADAFNFLIYDGEQVIKPEQLKDVDTTEIAIPYGSDDADAPVQRSRDLLKKLTVKRDDTTTYLLLGIENQTDIHYAMPARNMVYDALQYSAQLDIKAKQNRKSKGDRHMTGGEYLSGFRKTDRLIPVVTLVIYFGDKEWDAPTSLHEMMDSCNEQVMKYVADYKLNLITPSGLTPDDAQKLCSELREVLLYVKYSNDGDQLAELVTEDDRFKSVDRITVDVINVLTNSQIEMEENEVKIDMCKAIETIIAKGEARGQAIGEARGQAIGEARGTAKGISGSVAMLRSLNFSDEQIIEKLIEVFDLSEEEAARFVIS